MSVEQLLKGVTIAAGGVLPNIHPELLAKKRGSKGKLEVVVAPPPAKKPKTSGKKAMVKKLSGKKAAAAKAKVGQRTSFNQSRLVKLDFNSRVYAKGIKPTPKHQYQTCICV